MVLGWLSLVLSSRPAVSNESLTVELKSKGAPVARTLFGIFFEEINNAGEGGLYGELLMNRALLPSKEGLPQGWKGTPGKVTFDASDKLNQNLSGSIAVVPGTGVATLQNNGFWGIATKRGGAFECRLWMKGTGEVKVALVHPDGTSPSESTVKLSSNWSEYNARLAIGTTENNASLQITAGPGVSYKLGYASLTRTNEPFRRDLHQRLESMQPGFVRFPGGCYVEGNDLGNCFDWRGSLGPIQERKPTPRTFWGYTASNGFGYHEYLQLCETVKAEPMFVVNCGMSHSEIMPMDKMDKYVQDALDSIEYANGPSSSPMGALRARSGHPKPFGLKYIEIGNENGYSWAYGGAAPYYERFALIQKAIHAKYPEIQVISNVPVPTKTDLVSEHYYEDPTWFWKNKDRYDTYARSGPKIYVGEYAVTKNNGRGSLAGALSEAAFMTGMERNADIVGLASYAPLFENINNRQWNPNAIVFDNHRSYGTPSYWVQQMFAQHRIDYNLKSKLVAAEGAAPAIQGMFGFKTWKTISEFKDVTLAINGRMVYDMKTPQMSDFQDKTPEWGVADGVLRQSSLEQEQYAILKGIRANANDDWVFQFSARAVKGEEGFMALCGTIDHDQTIQWNVGGWVNRESAFQRNGARVGSPRQLGIVPGRWYRVTLTKVGNKLTGSLDKKVIEQLVETPIPNFASSVGVDSKKRELVLKLVNSSDDTRVLNLKGMSFPQSGTWQSVLLQSGSLQDENSLDVPTRVAPINWKIPAQEVISVPARSLMIVRIPRSKVKPL